MASFIEFTPVAHATKVTRLVRIDNDFKVTVSVDDDGTLSHHYFNFTGIPDEFTYRPDPPDANLLEARLAKDGTDEDLVTRINMFYNATDNALEAWQIPQPWIYGEPITKDAYLPGKLPELVSQSFPLVIWNTLKDTQTAPGANTASALTFERRYTQLATVAERRAYLKSALHTKIFHPAMPLWLMGAGEVAHQQAFSHWLEMLVRAIALDANLQTEARFNLLDGDIGLDCYELAYKINNTGITSTGAPLESTTRSNWTQYVRLGSVATRSPYAYTPPSGASWTGSSTGVAGLTLSGLPSRLTENNGRGWIDWLQEI